MTLGQRIVFCLCLIAAPAIGLTPAGGCRAAGVADVNSAAEQDCLRQWKNARLTTIECYGVFQTDASSEEEISSRTFDFVRGAKCGGTIRVQRAAFDSAIKTDGVLALDPQQVLCSISTGSDLNPEVTVTLAPKIAFKAKRAADVSPQVVSITSLPDFVVGALRSAAESSFVRRQLTKNVNVVLEQLFPN